MFSCRWRPIRTFSQSAVSRARRTIQEIRQSRLALADEKPTPEQLQKYLKRQSNSAFGSLSTEDPANIVNKMADEVWKHVLQASNNDPEVLKAWREELISRSTNLGDSTNKNPTSGPLKTQVPPKGRKRP